MVREVNRDNGTIYRCEEYGRTFEDRETATNHEDDCFAPLDVTTSGRPAGPQCLREGTAERLDLDANAPTTVNRG